MKNDNDVFREFRQSIKGLEGNLHVLETSIPVEKQMEYFKYSENVRNHSKNESVAEQIEILNSTDSSSEEKKYAMTFLATSGDIKAYRALEAYSKDTQDQLSDWASLSLLQAKITLESEFSEERQVFISTGLGGKGNKLRFYAFFKSAELKPFSKYQRDLIEKEIPLVVEKYQGELEDISIKSNYFSLVFLISLHIDLKEMLKEAISECNEYGDFINTHFVITNVKIFDQEDILKELRKK
ncbi:MAG: hypothetical protein FWF52_09130 [Candidatus Azobacteroides sp.]|nr:hypothetical protein [Candidatus Azobacteroides sp.]